MKLLPIQLFILFPFFCVSQLGITQEQEKAGGEIPTLNSLRLEFQVLKKKLEIPLQEFQEKYEEGLLVQRKTRLKAGALEEMLLVEEEIKGFRKGEHASSEKIVS